MWTHTYMCSSSLLLAREMLTLLYSVAFPERGIGLNLWAKRQWVPRMCQDFRWPPTSHRSVAGDPHRTPGKALPDGAWRSLSWGLGTASPGPMCTAQSSCWCSLGSFEVTVGKDFLWRKAEQRGQGLLLQPPAFSPLLPSTRLPLLPRAS